MTLISTSLFDIAAMLHASVKCLKSPFFNRIKAIVVFQIT